MPREDGGREDGVPRRRRRKLVIKEKNISSDEFMAASIGDVEWLDQSLRDGRNPSTFDKNGLAPIHLAALHGRLGCLKLLVEKYGVDVNLSSTTAWTPLHLCLNRESGSRASQCVNYLLANDADVNSRNDDNVTPAHQAASEGLLDPLQKLINHKATLNVADVRGHLPLDLAKLWGHRKCARLIRTQMWQNEKEERAEGLKQLQIVKQYYTELQKDAVHQLHNEQEFYGGVAFGNWLREKRLPEDLKHNSTFPRERYPEEITDGLAKRLRTSGGVDDCAQRMEKATLKQDQRISNQILKQPPPATTTSTSIQPKREAKDVSFSTQAKQETREVSILTQAKREPKDVPLLQAKPDGRAKKAALAPVTELTSVRSPMVQRTDQTAKTEEVERAVRVKRPEKATTPDTEAWQDYGRATFTPLYEIPDTRVERLRWKAPWNFSTNLDRDPITDIKCKDTVGLSIHPDDESASVLPNNANLLVQLDMAKGPKIRMTMPGGGTQHAKIRMPHLPSHMIYDVLSGVASDRIRIPQEFKAVHVYDIKKRRRSSRQPKDEVGMHLSAFGDPRILRRTSSMSTTATTRSPLSTESSTNDTCLPPVHDHSFKRMVDTLHRMNPPKAFLS